MLVDVAQLVDQEAQRFLDQAEAVLLIHRSRDVDDEDQVGGQALPDVDLETLEAQVQDVVPEAVR